MVNVYCVRLQMGNEKMNPFKNKNIRIKFYLFCRTHAFEHHRYIVEFYITKLSVQCSLPMCGFRAQARALTSLYVTKLTITGDLSCDLITGPFLFLLSFLILL